MGIEGGKPKRSADDRAEAVNNFIIFVSELTRKARGEGATSAHHCQITLKAVTIQDLDDLVEEMREAKLARAKLELQA